MGLGVTGDGRRVCAPLGQHEFAERVFTARADLLRDAGVEGPPVEAARPMLDVMDPRQVGWTFVVAQNDPNRQVFQEILQPLARERRMADPSRPLLFNACDDEWADWIDCNGVGLDDDVPGSHQLVVRAFLTERTSQQE